MRNPILCLALILSAAAASPASAEAWRLIGQSKTDGPISIDDDALVRDGKFRTVRTKWGYDRAYPEVEQMISVEKFDCQLRTFTTSLMITTYKTRPVERKAWDDERWEPVGPGSNSEAVFEAVCRDAIRG